MFLINSHRNFYFLGFILILLIHNPINAEHFSKQSAFSYEKYRYKNRPDKFPFKRNYYTQFNPDLNDKLTLKRFKKICGGELKSVGLSIQCTRLDILFAKDSLIGYFSIPEINKMDQELRRICSVIFKDYKLGSQLDYAAGSLYPRAVNSCMSQYLYDFAKKAHYGVKPVTSWKGSILNFIQTNKYEICITEKDNLSFMTNEKAKCRNYL